MGLEGGADARRKASVREPSNFLLAVTDWMAQQFKLLEDTDFEDLVGLICDDTAGWEQANDGEVKGERRLARASFC